MAIIIIVLKLNNYCVRGFQRDQLYLLVKGFFSVESKRLHLFNIPLPTIMFSGPLMLCVTLPECF